MARLLLRLARAGGEGRRAPQAIKAVAASFCRSFRRVVAGRPVPTRHRAAVPAPVRGNRSRLDGIGGLLAVAEGGGRESHGVVGAAGGAEVALDGAEVLLLQCCSPMTDPSRTAA